MKQIRFIMFLVILFLSVFIVAGALAADVTQDFDTQIGSTLATNTTSVKNGIDNISGSYSTWDNGEYGDACTSGDTNTLCFRYHIETNSWSYPHGLTMKLPPSWNATNGYLMDNWSCAGTGHPLDLTFVGGNEPSFNQIWVLQNPIDSCDAYYCMDVSTGGPEDIPWYIPSDGYGGGVEDTCDNSGYYTCDEAVQPPAYVPSCESAIYLTPDTQSGSACKNETVDYTLNLFNDSGSDGTFDLTYTSTFPISGPASSFVANGTSANFTVSVTVPDSPPSDTATVTASGDDLSDTATLTTTYKPKRWVAQPGSPIPTTENAVIAYYGKLYVVAGLIASAPVQIWDGSSWSLGTPANAGYYTNDACFGFDSNGDPVIDLFGDTYSFFTIARYNINSNSWLYPPLPPGFPSNGLWQPQIVSLYNVSGTNECVITGGGTSSYGGNTNGIYAYYPDTMTVEDWGDFSYSPAGIQSHFAWYVPWVGTAGSICVAGGIDANNVTYADSQCIDLSDHTIYAPNANLGPLPATWSYGADANGILAGSYQIWGMNGIDDTFSSMNKSFYYDGTAFVYGPDLIYSTYFAEADIYNGMVWVANGGITNNPVTWQEALIVCEEYTAPDIAVTAPPLEASLSANQAITLTLVIENIGTADLAWSVADGATWLTQLPESGTLAPGVSAEVVVTFDSAGLTPATYNTNLVITSDDPAEPTITLPAQLTVVQQFHYFWLPLQIKS